jgi:putative hemolysin
MWTTEILVMLAMIGTNGILAAYEIALASLTLSRLQVLVQEGRAGARAAWHMKNSMEGSLAVVQLGITLVGAIAAATGGAGAEEQISPQLQAALGVSDGLAEVIAVACVVLPLTVLTIIFGELMPKLFALRNKEWVCLRLSPAMRSVAFTVWPVVWFLETAVTTLMKWGERHWQERLDRHMKTESAELQELRASVALARTSRLIGPREEKIILGAAALTVQPVREIMLPAEAISMLDANASLAESLVAAHLDMHTRFPVTERQGDPQAIIGYANFKDIVAHLRLAPQEGSIRGILRTVLRLPDDSPVGTCLEHMMRGHFHIALVRNDSGQVVGLVTLEDILEELVGEIEDEYDRLPVQIVAAGRGWVVGGGLSLERLREVSGLDLLQDLPATGARTVSEWVIGHRQSPLRGGEVVCRGCLRAVVRKVRRQKVLEAQLESQPPDVRAAASR